MSLQGIIDYAIQNNWETKNVPERIRCFFTAWAHEYLLGADSEECKAALRKIYNQAAINELMDYDEFKEFMIQYIID